jgi:ATP-binding cassette, subfamily B, bacterial
MKMKMKMKTGNYTTILVKYLKNQKGMVGILLLMLFASMGLKIANPQIIKRFIDAALKEDSISILVKMAFLYIGIAVVQQFVSIVTTYLSQRIGWNATNTLREDLMEHCLKLDMQFHKDKRPGELIEIIDGDVNILFNFFSRLGVTLVSSSLLIIGVLCMYFREDYRIGIAEIIFCIVSFCTLLKIKDIGKKYWKKNREIATNLYGFVGEGIANTEDVLANGAKEYVMHRLYRQLKDWLPVRVNANVAGWRIFMVSLLLQAIGFSIAFVMGTFLWKKGMISPGTIYLFYIYTYNLLQPIDAIQRQLQDLQSASASIARIEELMNRESVVKDSGKEMELWENFELTVDNVTFGYDVDEDILKNISFHLPKGRTIGLLGRTGSGKTTLARLLMRFYDVNKGEIKLGGHNIKELSLKQLKRNVVYVTQEIQLFNGSMRDNLTFYNKTITDERILAAISEIGLQAWFGKFPKGLDTILGVDGVGLSAGESQLLAFIRVFLKDPYIIILDEVSSRLDPETERQLQQTIVKLLKDRLGIIIAHRIWTIDFVDDILILDNGRMLEYGKRAALEKDANSHFHSLLQTGLQEVVA